MNRPTLDDIFNDSSASNNSVNKPSLDEIFGNEVKEKPGGSMAAAANPQPWKYSGSIEDQGTPQQVTGIASKSDKAARAEADYLVEHAPDVVKPVPAMAAAQIAQGAGGKLRQIGEVVGSDVLTGYGTDLAEQGKVVEGQVQVENPLDQGTWANSIRNALTSIYQQAPGLVAGGAVASTGRATLGAMTSLLPMGAVTGGSAYHKYRERGFDVGTASLGSAAEEIVEVSTELLPTVSLFKAVIPGGKLLLKQFVTGMLQYGGSEYVGETIATLGQDITDKYLSNPAFNDEQKKQAINDYFTAVNPKTGNTEAWDNFLETMRSTTVQTGLMMGSGAAVRSALPNNDSNGLPPLEQGAVEQQPIEVQAAPVKRPLGPNAGALEKAVSLANDDAWVGVPGEEVDNVSQQESSAAAVPAESSALPVETVVTAVDNGSAAAVQGEVPVVAPVLSDSVPQVAEYAGVPVVSEETPSPLPVTLGGDLSNQSNQSNPVMSEVDEAQGWALERIKAGDTWLLKVTGEGQNSYLDRIVKDYRKNIASAEIAPVVADDGQPVITVKQQLPQKPVKVNPDKDSLLQAIAKLGGIDKTEAERLWGKSITEESRALNNRAQGWGKPVLKRNQGIAIDAMAQNLADMGYLQNDQHGKADINELFDKLFSAARGKDHYSMQNETAPEALYDQQFDTSFNPAGLGSDNEDVSAPAQAEALNPNRLKASQYALKMGDDPSEIATLTDTETDNYVRYYENWLKKNSRASAPVQPIGELVAERRRNHPAEPPKNKNVLRDSRIKLLASKEQLTEKESTELERLRKLVVDAAAHEAATSHKNDIPQPTAAQIEAGNYKKGHVRVNGLDITIENPAGSLRKGVDEKGREWKTKLAHHYGYLKGVIGADKDHLDVFIGPNPESKQVFVVDQVDPETGKFDEHKALLSFSTLKEARQGYLSNYDDGGENRIGGIANLPIDKFKVWLESGKTRQPYFGMKFVEAANGYKLKKAAKLTLAGTTEGALDEASNPVNSKAFFVKGANQGVIEDAKFFSNVLSSKTFIDQGFGGLNIETQLGMVGRMINAAKDDKVLNAVIGLLPVDVVNNLALRQLSAKMLFHNETMLKDALASNHDSGVAISRETADSLIRMIAATTTKNGPTFGSVDSETMPLKSDAALRTNTSDHGIPPVSKSAPNIQQRDDDGKAKESVDEMSKLSNTLFETPATFKSGEKAVKTLADAGEAAVDPDEVVPDLLGEKIGGARKDTAVASGSTVEKRIKSDLPAWQRRYVPMENIGSNGQPDGTWIIMDTTTDKKLVRKAFPSLQEAMELLPAAVVSIKHRVTSDQNDTFKIIRNVTERKRVTVKDGFPSREAAMEYMVKHAVEIIETNTYFGAEILARPDKVVRTGVLRRQGNAKAQDFMAAFGFRSAEFGNWNNAEERQEILNHAYDGLLDMADILNIPPKALSLNGELAIAFGARGQGLAGAAAHYEPAYAVINLTKMSGAGNLAHEWLHALDNYFARQDGQAKAEKVKNKRGDMVYPVSRGRDMVSNGFLARDSGVREEVRAAFKQVMQTLFYKSEQFIEDTEKAEKFVNDSLTNLEKRLDEIRRALAKDRQYGAKKKAATAEQLARFDVLAEKLTSGADIETEWRSGIGMKADAKPRDRGAWGQNRWTNDTIEGLSQLLKEITGRTGFSKERHGELDYLVSYVNNYAKRSKILKEARNQDEKTKKVPTVYRQEAYKMDQGRTSDYWTTNEEMAARAFSAYIEDKVEAQGGKSDFLSFGSDNKYYVWPFNLKPYPEGAERTAINEAFDKLFATIKTKETEKGTALYSNPMFNPELIVRELIGLTKNVKAAVPVLVRLGQVVIHEGADTYQKFIAGMRSYIGKQNLGRMWAPAKGLMLDVYRQAKAAYNASRLGGEQGSVTLQTKSAYEQRIDELFKTEAKASLKGIRILDSSDLLAVLGFGIKPVTLVENKVIKGMAEHNLKAEHWKKIPQWLEDPALVFDSATESGRLVFIAKELVNGSPVLMIIEPAENANKVNLMVNAYDKDREQGVIRGWVDKGLLRYFAKIKSAALDRSGLQLPGLSQAQRFDNSKIYRDADLVKYRTQSEPVRFSLTPVEPFYSKLQQVVEQKMGGRMPVVDLLKMLKSNGVADAEIDNVIGGIRDEGGVVSKAQVIEEIKANSVEFEDVVLGGKKIYAIEGEDGEVYTYGNRDEAFKESQRLGDFESDEEINDWLDEHETTQVVTDTHFSQYAEPGAVEGSYREMFVTAPEIPVSWSVEKVADKWFIARNGIPEGAGYYDKRGALDLLEEEKAMGAWQDGHSQYSDIKNPIVRIRFNEWTVDGGNVRKDFLTKLYIKYGGYLEFAQQGSSEEKAQLDALPKASQKILFVEEVQGPSDANQQKMPDYLRKRIYDIGVKRVLAYAKENGFDGVAWTTGDMQAQRYDLSKHFSKIEALANPDGTYNIFGYDQSDKRIVDKLDVPQEQLPDIVGKELTEKIVSQPWVRGEYKDLDLKVGGEGLKSLYDKTLPSLFKKYGKESVGESRISNTKDKSYEDFESMSENRFTGRTHEEMLDAYDDFAQGTKVPFIPITANTPASFAKYLFGSGKGIKRDSVVKTIAPLTTNWRNAPSIEVVQSESELPQNLRSEIQSIGAEGRVRGVFDVGRVFLVADNLNNDPEAVKVLLHEVVGHYGLAGMLGREFDTVLGQVAFSVGNKNLRGIAARYGFNLEVKGDRLAAAAEKLAEMAERGENPKLVGRAVAAVRAWLREMGLNLKWSDNDILALIARAKGWVENGKRAVLSDDSAAAQAEAGAGEERGGEAGAVGEAGQFSLAPEEQADAIAELVNFIPDKLADAVAPLGYRVRKRIESFTSSGFKEGIAAGLRVPFFQAEQDPLKQPFYDNGSERETERTAFILTMFGWEPGSVKERTKLEVIKDFFFKWQAGDKVLRWERLREEYSALDPAQRKALDTLVVEGDGHGVDYSTLNRARMNPRVRLAEPSEATFALYKKLRSYIDVHVEKTIVDGTEHYMRQGGVDEETVQQHISDYRKHRASRIGWMTHDHGEGDIAVLVQRTVKELRFETRSYQDDNGNVAGEQALLSLYPGKEIEPKLRALAAEHKVTVVNNGIGGMIFTKKGSGDQVDDLGYAGALRQFLEDAQSLIPEFVRSSGSYPSVNVYSHFVPTQDQADDLKKKIEGDYAKSMPMGFREGETYATITLTTYKLSESMHNNMLSDLALEAVQKDALEKMFRRGEVSKEELVALKHDLTKRTAEVLLGRAAGKYQIQRAPYLIEGFQTDNVFDLYQDYMTGVAGQITKAAYARKQFEAFQAAQPKVKMWAEKYITDSLRNMGRGDRISGNWRAVMTLWFMGFKVSSALINSTQPLSLGFANMGMITRWPMAKILRAQKDIMADTLASEEKELFNTAIYQAQEMETAMAEMSGHDQGTPDRLSRGLNMATGKSLALFQKIEVFNRKTMILAGYRVYRKAGLDVDAALKGAMKLNSATNFDMGRHNLPGWARGPVGRTLYALQNFTWNQLNWIYNRVTSGEKEQIIALMRYMGMMLLLGGLGGWPLLDEFDKLYRKLRGYSFLFELKTFMKKEGKKYGSMGDALNASIWHGLPSLAGVNVSNAIRLQIPIVSNVLGDNSFVDSALGVTGGMFNKLWLGGEYASRGKMYRAIEAAGPEMVSGGMRAYRSATDGVTTSHGKKVFFEGKPMKMSPGEASLRVLGFQPLRTSEASAEMDTGRKLEAYWAKAKKDALEEYVDTRRPKVIHDFNAKLKQSQAFGLIGRIESDDVQRAFKQNPNKKRTVFQQNH